MTNSLNILKNEPLSKYTTFKIGGPADYFVKTTTEEELIQAVKEANKQKIPFFILGGGSNVLVSDKGYRGMIIKNEMNKIQMVGYLGKIKGRQSSPNIVHLKVDSGVLVNRLVRYSLEQGLSGLENFLGQPGSVGGAVYINAHNMKKNDFFGEHLVEVKIMDKQGNAKIEKQFYFKFAYDESIIQKTKEIVIWVVIRFEKADKTDESWQKANEVMKYRQETQPYGIRSSGCTFRNIKKSDAFRIGSPNHTCSAGYLIDACGLKGKKIGGAKFSEKHANFIATEKEAMAKDVLVLITLAKNKVKEKFGVDLREEIVLVGDF